MIDPKLNYEFVINKLFKRCSSLHESTLDIFKGTALAYSFKRPSMQKWECPITTVPLKALSDQVRIRSPCL